MDTRLLMREPPDDGDSIVLGMRRARLILEGEAMRLGRGGSRYADLLLIVAKVLEAEALYEQVLAMELPKGGRSP